MARGDESGGLLDRGKGGTTAEPDEIEEGEGGAEAEAFREIAGEAGAEVASAGGDENCVDIGKVKTRFLKSFSGGGFGQPRGVLAETGDHEVGFKDKGVLYALEAKVAGFNPVAVGEDFAKEGTGAGGKLMILGSILECGKNLCLSEGAGGNGGADGVEKHGS